MIILVWIFTYKFM